MEQNQVNQETPSMQQTVYVQQMKKSNGMGTAGFVCSIVAIVLSWIPFINIIAGIIWILGLIFSIVGMFKQPKGLAIAGLVISLIGIVILLIIGASSLAFLAAIS